MTIAPDRQRRARPETGGRGRRVSGLIGGLFGLAALGAGLAADLAAAPPAEAAVWEDTETWSPQWEQRYRDWIEQDWNESSLHDPENALLFGLELDCADAVYTMRIVFAAAHKLPFAINDPRRGGRLLTNRSEEWDGLRQQLMVEDDVTGKMRAEVGPELTETEKLRRFIDDVNTWTTTQSLAQDTYPVALSEVRPGDMYLAPGNHAFVVQKIAPTGAMTTIFASLPRAWRPLSVVDAFPSMAPEDRRKRDGYRRFKPIEYLKTPAAKVPGASLEQWDIAKELDGDLSAFALATQEALAAVKETPTERAERRFDALCRYAQERVAFVDEALAKLERMQEEGRRCMTVGEYGDYSTPSRDKRLLGLYKLLRQEMESAHWRLVNPRTRRAITTIFAPGAERLSRDEELERCAILIDYLNGTRLTLSDLWSALQAELVTADPHAPRPYRWGLLGPWEPTCTVAKR